MYEKDDSSADDAAVHRFFLLCRGRTFHEQLRVRTHPDLDGYIIKKLDKGTVCKFMNKVDDKNGTDSWIYIIMEDGTVGWVFGAYARIEGNVDVQ